MKLLSRSPLWAAGALVAFLSTTPYTAAQEDPSPSPSPPSQPSPPAVPPPVAVTTTAPPSSSPTPGTSQSWSQPLPINPTFSDPLRENLTSPSFPDPEYVRLLDYTLLFYEAQRSGKLPANQRVQWRKDSALDDGKDSGVDLSGGYYDAGDYLKFIFPLTFAMTQTCWGGVEFWDGYQLAGQTTYLDQMVRWGMDWLIKAHPNNNTLWVQVGLGDVDNDYWGPDSGIPKPRPSFQVNTTSPGTDVTADAAAAFAACSILYRDKLNDPTYASTLQTHADSLFQMSETALPQQVYQVAVPAASCCYASSGFTDELAWGAAWMYKLTKNSVYAQKALKYINSLNAQSVQTNPVTWDDKTGLVYVLMAGATAGTGDGNAQWQSLAEQFATFTHTAAKPCMLTKGGLCRQLEATKIDAYRTFANGQIDYLLGNNPEKTPYVVGVHSNSPINPHSAPASGGNSADTLDTFPVKEAYTIYGALVGGPDKNDRFLDIRSDWRQNEVALDYNAPFNGLMAYQVMTSKTSPAYAVIPPGRPDLPPILNGMAVWQIILIVIGSIFVTIAIGAVICYRKRHQIRAWAAARKLNKHNKVKTHTLKNLGGPVNRRNQDHIVSSLDVPPPPPMRGQQRPVLPSPLPPREDLVLLENARR
ncbi:hypothetical protein BGZ98_005545 [Dissophora globulifera]|nr:hypothetical protein BGZ98_005545 [Dissophora globulifera]